MAAGPSRKERTPEQLSSQRRLYRERMRIAERRNIAVGWVRPDLTIDPAATHPDAELRKKVKR
jgi:ribonuclease D